MALAKTGATGRTRGRGRGTRCDPELSVLRDPFLSGPGPEQLEHELVAETHFNDVSSR